MSSWGPANRVQQLLANAHYNNALEEYNQGSYEAAIKLPDNARQSASKANITEIEPMQKYRYRILKMP